MSKESFAGIHRVDINPEQIKQFGKYLGREYVKGKVKVTYEWYDLGEAGERTDKMIAVEDAHGYLMMARDNGWCQFSNRKPNRVLEFLQGFFYTIHER